MGIDNNFFRGKYTEETGEDATYIDPEYKNEEYSEEYVFWLESKLENIYKLITGIKR